YPPEATSLPDVGGFVNLDPERITSFDPDLILTSTFLQDAIREELRRHHEVLHVDPSTVEEIYASILKIGARLDVASRAASLINDMRATFTR
ncbi:MAG: ABC transporter substrate-binding protein, partial [Halobacteriaceae archaeon]